MNYMIEYTGAGYSVLKTEQLLIYDKLDTEVVAADITEEKIQAILYQLTQKETVITDMNKAYGES